MPTLYIEATDMRELLDGKTIKHPVTGLRVVLTGEAIEVARQFGPEPASDSAVIRDLNEDQPHD
jgi:hypothetical protein